MRDAQSLSAPVSPPPPSAVDDVTHMSSLTPEQVSARMGAMMSLKQSDIRVTATTCGADSVECRANRADLKAMEQVMLTYQIAGEHREELAALIARKRSRLR